MIGPGLLGACLAGLVCASGAQAQCVSLALPVQVCPQDGQSHRFDDYNIPNMDGEITFADLVLSRQLEAVSVRYFVLTQRFVDDFWGGQPRYTTAAEWEDWVRQGTDESGWIITSAQQAAHRGMPGRILTTTTQNDDATGAYAAFEIAGGGMVLVDVVAAAGVDVAQALGWMDAALTALVPGG